MIDLRTSEPKPLFLRGPSPAVRLAILAALSVLLMYVDHRAGHLDRIRNTLSIAMHPIRVLVDLPFSTTRWLGTNLADRRRLLAENAELRSRALEDSVRLQRLEALQAENSRLRALMKSTAQVADRVLVSEIMAVDLDPFSHRIVINKGTAHGTFRGQALLDANGIVGQITMTSPLTSEAVLISDADHATPVEVNRNGLRTIAVGTGDVTALTLPYLPNNADVRTGDLLVSSGLGGGFPAGYPVAVITQVRRDPGKAFALVRAEPAAALNRSREVLLVWSAGSDGRFGPQRDPIEMPPVAEAPADAATEEPTG